MSTTFLQKNNKKYMDFKKCNFVQKFPKSFVEFTNLFFVFFGVQYSYEKIRKYVSWDGTERKEFYERKNFQK